MSNITVKLLTPPLAVEAAIENAALAALTCTGNEANLDNPNYDKLALLERITQSGHGSILEHINLTFRIEGISRALLQELARHRRVSLSVQSTRRTLGKTLLNPDSEIRAEAIERLESVFTARLIASELSLCADDAVHNLCQYLIDAIEACAEGEESADTVKYFLPELMPTNLVMTCNLRELRHIFYLREKPPALLEFNNLCAAIKKTLPLDIVRLLEVKEVAS